MQVLIYIGHFKTGSSTLQRFLAANWLALVRQGVLYPSVEARGFARNLRVLLLGHDEFDADDSLNILEPHNALALRLKNEEDGHAIPGYYPALPGGFNMQETIDQQIVQLSPRKVVLAAEVFSALSGTPEHKSIDRLAQRFARHDVTIICNLRRPDLHIASWEMQRLRLPQAEMAEDLRGEGLDRYLDSVHFDYARLIDPWMKHFPKARMVVRHLDDVRRAGGTVAQFLDVAGLKQQDFRAIRDQNLSLPRAYAAIGRALRRELPSEPARRVIRVMNDAPRDLCGIADAQVEMFGRFNRDRMMREFSPIHAKLGKMLGKMPFFSDLEGMGTAGPLSEIEAGRQCWPGLQQWLLTQIDDGPEAEWLRTKRF